MIDPEKLERLMAVLSLSFLYSYEWGLHCVWSEKHNAAQRKRKSDFRYGFELIFRILLSKGPSKPMRSISPSGFLVVFRLACLLGMLQELQLSKNLIYPAHRLAQLPARLG